MNDKIWLIFLVSSIILLTGCTSEERAQEKQIKQTDNIAETAEIIEKTEEVKQEPIEQQEQAKEDVPSTPQQAEQTPSQQPSPKQSAQSQAPSSEQPSDAKATKATANSNQPAGQKVQPAQPQQAAAAQPVQQPQPAQSEQKKETAMVTLSIRGDNGMILGKTAVELQDNDTVFSVLARTVKKKGIQMEYQGSGSSIYVQGIDNLYEMDRGPKSGWVYKVNSSYGTKSSGAVVVKQGSTIEWVYTIDGENP